MDFNYTHICWGWMTVIAYTWTLDQRLWTGFFFCQTPNTGQTSVRNTRTARKRTHAHVRLGLSLVQDICNLGNKTRLENLIWINVMYQKENKLQWQWCWCWGSYLPALAVILENRCEHCLIQMVTGGSPWSQYAISPVRRCESWQELALMRNKVRFYRRQFKIYTFWFFSDYDI